MAELDQSNVKDTLLGVLSYIDNPFKFLVVFTLVSCAFFGLLIYNNQGFLIQAWQKKSQMQSIDLDRSDEVATIITREAGALTVSIFEVDTILGKRTLKRAYAKGVRDKSLDGINIGLFTHNEQNNQDVIDMMAAKIPCKSYSRPRSEVGFWYLQNGVKYLCSISVPPEITGYIGQISVGLDAMPVDQQKLNDLLEVASRMLVKQ